MNHWQSDYFCLIFDTWIAKNYNIYRDCKGIVSVQKARRAVDAAYVTIPILKKGVRYMDIQAISTLITTVGFPIAACIALFWQNNKMSETVSRNTEAILELTTIIKERLGDGKN